MGWYIIKKLENNGERNHPVWISRRFLTFHVYYFHRGTKQTKVKGGYLLSIYHSTPDLYHCTFLVHNRIDYTTLHSNGRGYRMGNFSILLEKLVKPNIINPTVDH